MSVEWHRLGEYVQDYSKRCGDADAVVAGVDINKQFIETRANLLETDVSKYYEVPPFGFACNLMHIGRDERLPIAYNQSGKSIVVTSAYFVFVIRDSAKGVLLGEYLYMLLSRAETDRLTWFYTDSSVRGNLKVSRFLDIEIPVPPLAEQKKAVEAWQGLRKMKEQNEQLAEPLLALCRSYLQECKRKYELVEIGPMIERVDERNSDRKISVVKSVSVTKEFKDTNAKVDKSQLQGYKIVRPGHVSFVQTTGNEQCLCIAVNHFDEPIVVTSVNEVFKVDEKKMLADYLYLWWGRKESDRYARFNSWGSARETFNWADMCRVKIPLPPLDVQQAIVDVYRCANEAKKIAAEADRLSREICPALIQHVVKEVA